MYKFTIKNLKIPSNIHMVGIGGISMSSLARILLSLGHNVSGSDAIASHLTSSLSDAGINVTIGHNPDNVKNADLVCYTAAISQDNPEILFAAQNYIPAIERSVLLGDIMNIYRFPIAVSGTHGKTTTSSMLALALIAAGFDPTILVGGELEQIGGNYKIGKSDYLVCEACEYVESFLKFKPYLSIINNIEEDHMDYFKDIDHIISSFNKFAKLTSQAGCIAANFDDVNVRKAVTDVKVPVITYGIDNRDCDFIAYNIELNESGGCKFKVLHKTLSGEREGYITINLKVAGLHNVYNALAVVAACDCLRISKDSVKNGLYEFNGTKRRFERIGKTGAGTQIVDDYAHHPTEVTATLYTAKGMNYKKIWCIFQPHTYTRTKAFSKEFADALRVADHVIITDIYAAREQEIPGVHAKNIADKMQNALYIKDFSEISEYVLKNAAADDLIITMGAGNVNEIGAMLKTCNM